jgi:hypothetical protein
MEKGISDKDIENIKKILEKEHNREFTWEEATKAMDDIKGLARIMYECASKEIRMQERLKENPKGFHLDDSGQCSICGDFVSKENSWFDEYGIKCMSCQKAINSKIIPASVAKDKESWYSKHELDSYFNIKGPDLKKYIKESFLKERIIPYEGKKAYFQLFLLKDNKDVLPPKKLLKSRIIKVMNKGEEFYTQAPWYEFADEKLIKRLAKYKILYCLPDLFSNPVDSGRLLFKQINPLFKVNNSNT